MTDKLRVIILLGLLVLLPISLWRLFPLLPMLGTPPALYSGGKTYPESERAFKRIAIGDAARGLPQISNVQILDFDKDGQNDVLICDMSGSRVSLITEGDAESWEERTLLTDVAAPAHATAVDIDQDGNLDLVVSILGNSLPDDGVIGRVELYLNENSRFTKHVILDDVRRVADVQPGDFDGDGKIDLAVAVFGYARGEVLWLKNLGENRFERHQLLNAPGTIHVPVADYDGDGDQDIAAIVTQDEEELWGFENLGSGKFRARRLWNTINLDLGSAGLVKADLDQDGDTDLILPAGDNLEDAEAYPQPYHGCYWFENRGNWTFDMHRISDLGGTYAAAVGDLDGDGDQDVSLVSMVNDWYDPSHGSVIWLENDGKQNFKAWQIDTDPIHQVTIDIGDLDGDGKVDLVTGGLNMRKPFERIGRITAWFQKQD